VNVIWSAAVRDTLLLAADYALYRPAWSRRILREMADNLKSKRPDLDPRRIDRTVERMLQFFPEALIEGFEHRIESMAVDAGDRHVLAAAVHAQAQVLVTWNTRHFPAAACGTFGIAVHTADAFLCSLLSAAPEKMLVVLGAQASHLINPPQTVEQILDTLQRSVPEFATRARRLIASGGQ
jgi:hypothetical protein